MGIALYAGMLAIAYAINPDKIGALFKGSFLWVIIIVGMAAFASGEVSINIKNIMTPTAGDSTTRD